MLAAASEPSLMGPLHENPTKIRTVWALIGRMIVDSTIGVKVLGLGLFPNRNIIRPGVEIFASRCYMASPSQDADISQSSQRIEQ